MFNGKPNDYYEGLDKRTSEYKAYKRHLEENKAQSTGEEEKVAEKPLKEEKSPSALDTPKTVEYLFEVGSGDILKKITTATGIDKVVKKLFGEDCGCDERQRRMNANLSYFSKRRGNYLTEDEFKFLVEYFKIKPGVKKTAEQVRTLQDTYNRVFNFRKRYTTCSPCIVGMERNLKRVVEYYLNDLGK